MSKCMHVCNVCGKKAKFVIRSYEPMFHSLQKVFYCCGKTRCRVRIEDYIKERGERTDGMDYIEKEERYSKIEE